MAKHRRDSTHAAPPAAPAKGDTAVQPALVRGAIGEGHTKRSLPRRGGGGSAQGLGNMLFAFGAFMDNHKKETPSSTVPKGCGDRPTVVLPRGVLLTGGVWGRVYMSPAVSRTPQAERKQVARGGRGVGQDTGGGGMAQGLGI